MPDKEKVIKGIWKCLSHKPCSENGCPYENKCAVEHLNDPLLRDVLTLLEEQEAVAPVIYSETMNTLEGTYAEISIAYCGNCGWEIDIRNHKDGGYNYCPKCGKEVKWNA